MPQTSPDHSAERTARRVLAARRGRPVSTEEAREACANLAGFFRVLGEWDRLTREAPGTATATDLPQTKESDG